MKCNLIVKKVPVGKKMQTAYRVYDFVANYWNEEQAIIKTIQFIELNYSKKQQSKTIEKFFDLKDIVYRNGEF